MVRLITHNLLSCHSRLCAAPTNFPLRFDRVTNLEIRPTDDGPNVVFLSNFWDKLDWSALVAATRQLGQEGLAEERPNVQSVTELDEVTLGALHRALMEIHVVQGNMVCPSCEHIYAIKDGIPNMLLAEHEINR